MKKKQEQNNSLKYVIGHTRLIKQENNPLEKNLLKIPSTDSGKNPAMNVFNEEGFFYPMYISFRIIRSSFFTAQSLTSGRFHVLLVTVQGIGNVCEL